MAESVRKHNRLPFESDFYDKPSFLELRKRHGWAAVGMVFALCGQMWRRSDTSIGFSELPALAYGWHIEPETKLLEVVTFCIKLELFERIENYEAQLELGSSATQATTSQVKSSQVNQDKTENARAAFHCPFVTREAEDYEKRMASVRARGKAGGKASADQRAVVWPAALDTPECKAAWADWLEHKKERGERYKSAKSQQAKLTELAPLGPSRFIAAIIHSRGNNWAGIYEPKLNSNGTSRLKPSPFPEVK